jgi:hypothetical protein
MESGDAATWAGVVLTFLTFVFSLLLHLRQQNLHRRQQQLYDEMINRLGGSGPAA